MKPIRKFLKNFLSARRLLGDSTRLKGLARADAILASLVSDKKIPGLAITVLKRGEVLLQKGYGCADLEKKVPVDPDNTLFRVGSVSKPIAATALAKMVGEGTISLDASYYDHVPDYPPKKYDFTIRQLAGHTSGLRGYRGKEYGLSKPYSIREGIAIFKDDPLLYPPGTDYLYNSYGWVLISLAMQEASGISFEEYVRTSVLHPLGMLNTQPETPDAIPRHLATFYSKNQMGFKKAIPVDNFYKLAGGGYLSTSGDIAKLGQAYLDKKIADEPLISQFLSSVYISGQPTWYGLGWQVSEDNQGRRYFGHVGNGVGVYANFYVYPEEQQVFSIMINCTNPDVQSELDEVIDSLISLGSANRHY